MRIWGFPGLVGQYCPSRPSQLSVKTVTNQCDRVDEWRCTNLQPNVLLDSGAGGGLVPGLGESAERLVLLLHLGLQRGDLVLEGALALLPSLLLIIKL